MANFERTKQLMDKLKAGGSEITAADTLMAFIKLGTDLGNVWATSQQDKVKTQLDLSLTGLSMSAQDLNYTDYQKKAPEGFDGDLYDYNRDIFIMALENVETTLKTPYIEETYGDAIDLAIRSNQAALAYQDTMRGQRATNITEMTELMEQYTAMAQSDPLLTDTDDYTQAQDIMQHLTDLRTHIEKQTGQQMISEHLVPLQKVQKEFQIISDLHQMDRNKTMDGIQANIEDEYSPYLKKWMEEKGIITTGTTADEMTLGLPEDDPKTKYIDESRIFTGTNASEFTEALTAFNDYQSKVLALDAKNIFLEQAAEEVHPFEVMRDWMEAPGSNDQAAAGNVISYQLFSDTKYTFEENISGRGDLKDVSITPGTLKNDIVAKYNELYVLDKEGKYPEHFRSMQTTYNKMQTIQDRMTGKTIDQLDEVTASAVRETAKNLNNQLVIYNAQFKNKDDPRIITETPNFAEKTAKATTREAKVKSAEILDELLKKANALEMERNEPGAEIKLIRDFENAKGEGKWLAMKSLVDKYLTPMGFRINDEEINAAFDAPGPGGDWWGSGDEEQNDVDTFYSVLQSFQALINADPTGTTPLSFLDILSGIQTEQGE